MERGSTGLAEVGSPLLRVAQLSLRFGGTLALSDVGLELSGDELLGIVGPNGAGKTALINCITGAYRPTTGQISFAGANVVGLQPNQIAEMGIARTFQNPELLFDDLDVLANVMLGRHRHIRESFLQALIGSPAARKRERANRRIASDILQFFDLTAFATRPPTGLPYGVQKGVELARALAMDPRLLILDEPASGMTRSEKAKIVESIRRIRSERGITVVLIEHDLQMVRELCERVIVLVSGSVIADGVPSTVFANQAVIDSYLGAS